MASELPRIERSAASDAHPLSAERCSAAINGETIGWTVFYQPGKAIWCGELTRAHFVRLPLTSRAALQNDLGWFLIEYDFEGLSVVQMRVLAKVADEKLGRELALVLARGRLVEIQLRS